MKEVEVGRRKAGSRSQEEHWGEGVAAPSPHFQFPTAPATELPPLSLALELWRGACQTGLPEA